MSAQARTLTIKALNQDKDNEELKQDFFEIKIVGNYLSF